MKKTFLCAFAALILSACASKADSQKGNTDSAEAASATTTETISTRAEAEGPLAPDFKADLSDGRHISLQNVYLGSKLVLLDFWASWCGPCRGEIPHLKEAYEKYHSKGFEILSVSLDREREPWINAMDKFQMNWLNTWDADGKIADLYGVTTIPATFLIDREGRVIATDLRGEQLEQKLSELL